MGCMRRSISRLMITMQNKIETGEIRISLFVRDFHHACEVQAVVLLGIVFRFLALPEIFQAVDISSNHRQLCSQVEAVLQRSFPVNILLHAMILLCKYRVTL